MRVQTWRIALEAFIERLLLGQDPAVSFEINEASRTREHAADWETPPGGMPWVHNGALKLLAERGVIGTGLFAALMLCAARDLKIGLKRGLAQAATRASSAAIAASLVSFAARSLLDLSLLKDWCSVCLWSLVRGRLTDCLLWSGLPPP